MAKHYLAINHESHDSSTVFGVFDTFNEARGHLEAEAAVPNSYSSAHMATIEEWDGATPLREWERGILNPLIWEERT